MPNSTNSNILHAHHDDGDDHDTSQPRNTLTPAKRTRATTQPDATSKQSSAHDHDQDAAAPVDSFSSYMRHKNRKLRQQFTSEFSESSKKPIFAGVVVWVNGHTKPSRLQIRRIMGKHGGRLETYCTPLVTHVVATNLATATRLRFTNRSNTSPAVKLVTPQWITASLTHARRLPEIGYPIPFMTHPNQPTINSFFAPKSNNNKNKHPHTPPF